MRDKIDRDIAAGLGSLADIAARYGLSKSALARHKNHLGQAIVQAETNESYDVRKLVSQVNALSAHALETMAKCEKAGDIRTALLAMRESRECLALLLRVGLAVEELKRRPIENGKEDFSDVDLNKLTDDELQQVSAGNYAPLRRIASGGGLRPVIFIPQDSDD